MTRNHLIIALWAGFLAVAGLVLATSLKIDDDLTVFLPSNGAPIEDLIFSRLREGPAAKLILVAFEGGTAEGRVQASKSTVNALEGMAGLVQASNGERPMSPETLRKLFDYRFLTADAGALDLDALRNALTVRAEQLESPFGKIYEKAAAQDPTGLFEDVLVSWQDGTKPPPREEGVWVSADGTRSLVLVETDSPGYTLDRQSSTVLEIEERLSSIAVEHSVQLLMAGAPVNTFKAKNAVRDEMVIGSAVAFLLIASFLLSVYRSARLLILVALPIATGLVMGLAVTIFVFDSIHRIALAFGITLLGVAIDYPLHLFSHTHLDEKLRRTAERIMPPMLLGAVTTIAAFLVLGTGGFAGLAQLAVFIASGLAAAVATALFVLPSLSGERRMFRGTSPSTRRSWAPPRWISPSIIGLTLLAVVLLGYRADVMWEKDLSELSPVPTSAKILDGALRADLGAPDLRFLFLTSGDDAESMLKASEALEPKLQALKDSGAIGGFDAVHRYIPSEATQMARQAALPETNHLKQNLALAADTAGLDPSLFAPFVQAVEASKALSPISPDDQPSIFQGTPLWPKLVSLMTKHDDRWYGFVPLSAVQDLESLRDIGEESDQLEFMDLKTVSAESITDFRNAALVRLGAGLVVIMVLLYIVLRDFVLTLRIVFAMISALAMTAGLMLLLGEKFSLFHILASLVVIGVGLDYGLFFSWKTDSYEDRSRAFHGIAICAVSTTIVFALLAMSSISVLHVIGLTVALGTCLTFLTCYLFVALPTQRVQAIR
ncbi:MAG: MMPL family transporter [Pseudomonadota bacterium]